MNWVMLLALVSLFAGSAQAALAPQSLEKSLIKKSPERMAELRKTGPGVYRKLHKVAFDEKQPYQLRWRALMSMAWMGQKESLNDLEAALKSKDWFMRDAGLQALTKIDQKNALTWARKLLSDPALVVRTTAVGTIRKLEDRDSEALLWAELYRKINYRGKQSLWIRRHIAETLSVLSGPGSEMKFAALLDDSDRSLHLPAMQALERLTGKKPGRASRLFWKTWAKNSFQN